jgi:hypothetical protein
VSSAALHAHPDSITRLHSASINSRPSLEEEEVIVHPAEPKAKIPMLRSLVVSSSSKAVKCQTNSLTTDQEKRVDDHPLCWIGFQEDCIITTCKKGQSHYLNPPSFRCLTRLDEAKLCLFILHMWQLLGGPCPSAMRSGRARCGYQAPKIMLPMTFLLDVSD